MHMYIHTYIFIYIDTYIHTKQKYVCKYTYIYIYTYTYMYVYVHRYIVARHTGRTKKRLSLKKMGGWARHSLTPDIFWSATTANICVARNLC